MNSDLDYLYTTASHDQALSHPFTTLAASLRPWEALRPQMHRLLSPIVGSYPAAFDPLYARLSGEEREILRLVHDYLHEDDSPRQQLYQELGVDTATPLRDDLPGFIQNWQAWWQASATVKPLPEAFGAFAVAFPVIEHAFLGQLRHHPALFTTFLLETEKQRKHWEAVLTPYLSRLDLIAQGTRQALRQWQTLQDQLLAWIVDNRGLEDPTKKKDVS